MMTDQEEIATLRAQITEAEGRIAVLEAKQSRKSGTVPIEEERGVTISEVQAVVACALSDEKQLRQLADIVLEQFPQLAPTTGCGFCGFLGGKNSVRSRPST